jgi:hypothetical protein
MAEQEMVKWVDRPTDDGAMITAARELEQVLWKAVLARLSDEGQVLLAFYQLLFTYEKLVGGRLTPGPLMEMNEIRESMKKTLDQATFEAKRIGLSSVSTAEAVGGPGGIRTHDPHNAIVDVSANPHDSDPSEIV